MEIEAPGARSEQTTGMYRGPREGQGGQLRNPRERKLRRMGPTGRARARTDRKERGKQRTAASTSKGSPMAKRRQGNRKAR